MQLFILLILFCAHNKFNCWTAFSAQTIFSILAFRSSVATIEMYCLYDGFAILTSYFLWRLKPSDFFVILEAFELQICLDEKILVKEKVLLQSSDERRPQIYPQHSSITQASIVQKQTPLIFLIRPRMRHWVLHKMLLQVGILKHLQHKKERFHNSTTDFCVLKLTKSISHGVYYIMQCCVICVLIGHKCSPRQK